MKQILFFIIALVGLLSCTGQQSTNKILGHADSMLNSNDDSCLAVTSLLDGQRQNLHLYTEAQRMKYELLYAKAMNKAYIDFTSDSIMKKVALYYDKHGSKNEQMEAYYLLGCVYRDLGDVPKAIEVLHHASECADTLDDNCDFYTLCRIHSQQAALYQEQCLPRIALQNLNKAISWAYKSNDTLAALSLYAQMSFPYAMLNDIDSAIRINEHASEGFLKQGRRAEAAMTIGGNIRNYIKNNEISKAANAICVYEKESGVFKNGNVERGREVYYDLKASFFLKTNHVDSAIYYFRKEMRDDPSYSGRSCGSYGLALAYSKLHQTDSVAKYALLSTEYSDSDYNQKSSEELTRMNGLYNYNSHKALAVKKEKEATRLKITLCVVVLLFIILLLSVYIVYQHQMAKRQKEMQIVKRLYNRTLDDIRTEKENVDKLRRENLEEYKKEIEEREQKIAKLSVIVDKYERELNVKKDARHEFELHNSSIFLTFDLLCKRGGVPTEEQWKALTDELETKIPLFKETVNHFKVLSKTEYRICVLTRFGFSPSDTNCLLGGQFKNISVTRKRLLKKVFNIDGTGKDFDSMISSI